MLKLTIEDYYEKTPELPKATPPPVLHTKVFQMKPGNEMTYRGDRLKLWRLKDEVKTRNYLQKNCTPEEWLEHQIIIEEIEFRITAIFMHEKNRCRGIKNNRKFSE